MELENYTKKDAIKFCSSLFKQTFILEGKESFIKDWMFFKKEQFFFTYHASNDIDFFHGYIDGIFLYDNKYYMIDWKTDNLKNSDVMEEYTDLQYRTQYMLYCFILLREIASESKIWEEKFGGFIYVYLRETKEKNYIIKKPSCEEILDYINKIKVVNK